MDKLTPDRRSANMAKIRSRDTKPEMVVRRLVHGLGYRYSLHRRDLPGKPDLVFAPRKKIIFVHGCYWHMHDCKQGAVVEATRTEFWQAKRKGNVGRDQKNLTLLSELGWQVLVVWACEIRDPRALADRLVAFLKS